MSYSYKLCKDIRYEESNGVIILLNINNGKFFEINSSGSDIFHNLMKGYKVDEVQKLAEEKYEQYQSSELEKFIEKLVLGKFITRNE